MKKEKMFISSRIGGGFDLTIDGKIVATVEKIEVASEISLIEILEEFGVFGELVSPEEEEEEEQ